jgi:hypothetical protein
VQAFLLLRAVVERLLTVGRQAVIWVTRLWLKALTAAQI